MAAPIRIAWFNYPGVGEYGAWRVHGGHDGFDSYTLPKATIYGTADGGVVIGKGYVAGGWGHYIDVRYPGYTQRDCHMHEASGLRIGARVDRTTALGRVGQTGNAKGIAWWHNGVWLWHVHSEVYLSRTVQFNKRTNPLPVWGVTTAGGGIEIIDMATPEEIWAYQIGARTVDGVTTGPTSAAGHLTTASATAAANQKRIAALEDEIWGRQIPGRTVDGIETGPTSAAGYLTTAAAVSTANRARLIALEATVKALAVATGQDPEALAALVKEAVDEAIRDDVAAIQASIGRIPTAVNDDTAARLAK